MHCQVSPAPPLAVAQPACTLRILPVDRRRAPCFPRLRLRPGPRLSVRAQNRGGDGDGVQPPRDPPHNFVKERSHIISRTGKIILVQEGLLYYESRNASEYLCVLAEKALDIASHIVDSAKLDMSNVMSSDTIHRTLRAYAGIFMQTADDTCNRTVSMETITSFLGALRGLASITHILLEAALETVSHEHPKESLSEFAFNYDMKIMHRNYNRRMDELEDDINRNAAAAVHACELVSKTINQGMKATESIVGLMMDRRHRALDKAHSKLVE
ncbi:unnamed protein product [Urochloa decumbens]|uniref:Uncharacterized protein n=1 Tax=Urochloa decumbens TaxID=240449 RepID=A0ABC8Z6W8_9POAL